MNTKICVKGHPMAADETDCSECGSPAAANGTSTPAAQAVSVPPTAAAATGSIKCSNPNCRKPLPDDAQFCEFCGTERSSATTTDATTLPVSSGANGRWIAIWTVDPVKWQKENAAKQVPPAREYYLDSERVRIGRYSVDELSPEIDLPEDEFVSRHHAALERQPDGSFQFHPRKAGTMSTLDGEALTGTQLRPIKDGSVLHLGAYSIITFTHKQ